MKTAIIIHGMPDKEEYYDPTRPASSNCHWLPWIQKQLLLKDIIAQTPEMPMPYNPDYQSWKETLELFPITENTILIGHSCGAGLIARYLSENNAKVGKVVLVAPWIDPDTYLDTGMFDFSLDENLVSKTKGVTLFASTNDMDEVQKSVQIIMDKVKDIKLVEFKDKGHFCHRDMETDAFPKLLAEF